MKGFQNTKAECSRKFFYASSVLIDLCKWDLVDPIHFSWAPEKELPGEVVTHDKLISKLSFDAIGVHGLCG